MSKWKQYYKCIKLLGDNQQTDYWFTNNIEHIMQCYDLVLPMGRKKPSSLNGKEILT